MAINTTGFTLSNHFPLRIAGGGNTAFMNIINGNNLVRKSAQLVNDIEGLRDAPKTLEALNATLSKPNIKAESAKPAGFPATINETSFQTLVDKINAQLEKSDKPFTLLNIIDAQKMLSKAESEKAVDTKA
jgi:hypothetical protein